MPGISINCSGVMLARFSRFAIPPPSLFPILLPPPPPHPLPPPLPSSPPARPAPCPPHTTRRVGLARRLPKPAGAGGSLRPLRLQPPLHPGRPPTPHYPLRPFVRPVHGLHPPAHPLADIVSFQFRLFALR